MIYTISPKFSQLPLFFTFFLFMVEFVNNFEGRILTRAVFQAQKKVLRHQGALLRRNAARSIRSKKTPSKPGSPPRSVLGGLKKGIQYAYDDAADSVVVGPVKFERKKVKTTRTLEHGGHVKLPESWRVDNFGVGVPAGKGGTGPVLLTSFDTAPEADWSVPWGYGEHDPKIPKLSAGWSNTLYVVWRHLRSDKEVALAERNYEIMQRLRKITPTTKRFGTVAPRPFMEPALQKSRKKLLELWKDAVG